jgi:rubredoxin
MTSAPEQVTVQCPACGLVYQDWYRASINLDLGEEFDAAYLDECGSAVCPGCKHKVYFQQLIVQAGIFRYAASDHEPA